MYLLQRAATHFSPHQLGVGVRNGAEAIVHAAREALDKDPSKFLLRADLINAFNQADRGIGLEEVAANFPEILSWMCTSYGAPSHLLYAGTILSSETGFHQGDPLAGLGFALVLHPLVLRIQVLVPTLAMNSWFYDDGTKVGNRKELQTAVDVLVNEGPRRGLHLSTSLTSLEPKTDVWCPLDLGDEGEDPLQRGVPRVRSLGVILLGLP